MLSFDADTSIDEEFYRQRLADALRMRQVLGLRRHDNNAFRLVHGEGDFLPGLVVDVYGDTAVIQAHSPGMHYARHTIASVLTGMPEAGIRNIYYKSETTLPYKARLDPVNDYLIGHADTDVAIENSLKFHVDWLRGQKRDSLSTSVTTGHFWASTLPQDACSICFATPEASRYTHLPEAPPPSPP